MNNSLNFIGQPVDFSGEQYWKDEDGYGHLRKVPVIDPQNFEGSLNISKDLNYDIDPLNCPGGLKVNIFQTDDKVRMMISASCLPDLANILAYKWHGQWDLFKQNELGLEDIYEWRQFT